MEKWNSFEKQFQLLYCGKKKRKKNLSITIHVQHKHMEHDLMNIYN